MIEWVISSINVRLDGLFKIKNKGGNKMSKCIKTPICGSYYTECDGDKHMIFYSGVAAEKFVSLTIINVGDCEIQISKNNESEYLVLEPGGTVSVVDNTVNKLFIKCVGGRCIGVCSVCWKGYAINTVPCLCEEECDS